MKIILKKIGENWVYVVGLILLILIGLIVLNSKKVSDLRTKSQNTKENQSQSVAKAAKEEPGKSQNATGSTTTTTKPENKQQKDGQKGQANAQTTSSVSVQNIQNVSLAKDVEQQTATVKIVGLGNYTVPIKDGDTGFDILGRASSQYGFAIGYKVYSFGVMITRLGNVSAEGHNYWALYYNGGYATVGASDLKINNKDVTEWRLESW